MTTADLRTLELPALYAAYRSPPDGVTAADVRAEIERRRAASRRSAAVPAPPESVRRTARVCLNGDDWQRRAAGDVD